MFSMQRFLHVLVNDLKAHAKRLLLGTGGAMVIGVLIYTMSAGNAEDQQLLYLPVFAFSLLLGGAIFTSSIYADIHSPTQRYLALMLPVSALERFTSRYLISGPLFLMYFILMFRVFEFIARGFTLAFQDEVLPSLNLASEEIHLFIWTFVAGHALVLLGAILFRNYALPKTALAMMGLFLWFTLLVHLTVKVFFWSHFASIWSLEIMTPIRMELWIEHVPERLLSALGFLFYCWILFMGYTALQDHEV